jgi:hypothetical protein
MSPAAHPSSASFGRAPHLPFGYPAKYRTASLGKQVEAAAGLNEAEEVNSLVEQPVYRVAINRHKRPIASHFHSVALEIFYLGEDLDEADG